jgi:imidazoleglycerol phosphate synthase glutamine amidotransferase subunit HisH
MGVCLGMQCLFARSLNTDEHEGLVAARRQCQTHSAGHRSGFKVPHIG